MDYRLEKRTSFAIFRSVLFALVLREMQGRFGTIRMGPFFTLLEPCLHILGFAILYSAVRGGIVAGVEYPVFLLIGLTPFLLFRNIALQMMESLEANRALFSYRQILPLDTFIARALVEFSLSSIVFWIIFLGFLWYGLHPTISDPFEWLATISLGLLFAFGLGCIFAVITHSMPQMKMIIRLSFLPLYLTSGVLFTPARLPPDAMKLLLWNPFLHLIELIRSHSIPYYKVVDGVSNRYVLEVTVIVLFLGLGLYRSRKSAMMRL